MGIRDEVFHYMFLPFAKKVHYTLNCTNHNIIVAAGRRSNNCNFLGRFTITTLLCFELQQIWDHFYYTNDPHLYNKSGLGFVLTHCPKNYNFLIVGHWPADPEPRRAGSSCLMQLEVIACYHGIRKIRRMQCSHLWWKVCIIEQSTKADNTRNEDYKQAKPLSCRSNGTSLWLCIIDEGF